MVSPTPPPPARAVLFDADGVLVDSHAGYRRVWDRWSALHGLDPDAVHAATHGRRVLDTLAEVAPHLDAPAEVARLTELVDDDPEAFALYPDARALVEQLHPLRWAVVTSGDDFRVRDRLRAGGAPVPDVVIGGAAVARGKPDPEGYLLAARLLGVAAADCVVVEDAPAGVAAGRAAGMPVIALTTSNPAPALSDADLVVASLAEAGPHLLAWAQAQPSTW
ncbi:HAD-IA family hydrolase [Streptomyces sp. NP160]|uniref:HAD-IA family hydrolase n=1 Tax=Streptomyces sp. NP160 TaxID=2586637 RepID=UPI00111B8131|nr:HAD-IA family hydrolase [Streptomyces sp. NP160]TNM64092.1 HAD-IA family hydrolase [Streptomyces sp. NP160]